ncbi:LacI family transcriptional regulator [Rathayibacter sp. PhB185]|nr:LacI family transcriptional regulator [Rathayibacter sp. PhB186]ROS46973.1 LacI family transcriptional regulator [Rathayibacter sp. PhB185]TCL83118.1 LacI family transcriptional regulator [Rathayibacter sp. PhB192]TCM28616.1 LacI family transcriptional regulator [Rathayibacter sp. PhB179]
MTLDQQERASSFRRPSMDDVAAEAGVSKGAVSKVIRNAYGVSPAMRERVEGAIARLGYRPRIAARSMRGPSFTIGFELPQLGNDFFNQVMQGVGDTLAGSQYQLIMAPGIGELRGAPVLDALADRQVDGILAISPEVTPEWLENLARTIPLVLIGRHDASAAYDTVTNNDAAGVGLVMDHLRALTHTRIAHLTVRPAIDQEGARAPHAIRLTTYLDRMHEDGLSPDVVYCDAFEMDAYRAAKTLIEKPDPPTAIVAGNDTLAVGALRAVAEASGTRRAISVVGYDDIDLASHPFFSLTTVDQFGVEAGRAAMTMLLERIQGGRSEARHFQLEPELRIRTSSRVASS